jgi:general stress protein 26
MKIAELSSLIKFLENQKAATIAVPIDDNGNIHAASLVFWNSIQPFSFFFITSRNSEKYTLMKDGNKIPCAVVLGTEKGTDFTLQMRGSIQEVVPEDYSRQVDAYYRKRGNRQDDITESETCLLQFVPTWARYTDYSKGYNREFIDLN